MCDRGTARFKTKEKERRGSELRWAYPEKDGGEQRTERFGETLENELKVQRMTKGIPLPCSPSGTQWTCSKNSPAAAGFPMGPDSRRIAGCCPETASHSVRNLTPPGQEQSQYIMALPQ
jgi:hypothetical protein